MSDDCADYTIASTIHHHPFTNLVISIPPSVVQKVDRCLCLHRYWLIIGNGSLELVVTCIVCSCDLETVELEGQGNCQGASFLNIFVLIQKQETTISQER